MYRTSGFVILVIAALLTIGMLLWPVHVYDQSCGSTIGILDGHLDSVPMTPGGRAQCAKWALGRVATTVTMDIPLLILGIYLYRKGLYPDNRLRWPTES